MARRKDGWSTKRSSSIQGNDGRDIKKRKEEWRPRSRTGQARNKEKNWNGTKTRRLKREVRQRNPIEEKRKTQRKSEKKCSGKRRRRK